MADCKHYKEFEQIKLDAERYGLEPIQDPTGNITACHVNQALLSTRYIDHKIYKKQLE